MNLIEYPDDEMLAIDVANQLAGELNTCLLRHEWASFAVPGGTTPGPMFEELSAASLDWDRVHVMLTDERWVPDDHERSNTRLLRETLLTDKAASARFIPFWRAGKEPEDAIDEIAADIRPELPISILLLGMGSDMHTASLFPGADRLNEALRMDSPLVLPMRAPGAPEARITLTAPALKSAMTTHILITGDEKRAALERATKLSPEEAPVRLVLDQATVHWAA